MQIIVILFGDDTIFQEGRHFVLNGEAGVPAWFSGLLLAAAAGMSFVFAVFKLPYPSERRYWTLLGVVFLALSLDEVASFHEAVLQTMRDWLGMSGPLHFAWVLVFPFVVLLAFIYLRFVFRLPQPIRTRIILAGSLFLGGALGVEMIGGVLLASGAGDTPYYQLAVLIEEAMEISGVVVFLSALFTYAQDLDLRITKGPVRAL